MKKTNHLLLHLELADRFNFFNLITNSILRINLEVHGNHKEKNLRVLRDLVV